jgi:pimeloyl-ACP methyl ester carboxylesterase
MSWSAVWEELARSFTVVAPDIPGYGSSDPAESPGVTGSARVIEKLLDGLGLGQVSVVGNSMGVAFAIELASFSAARVSHLVAVNGSALPHIPGFLKALIRRPFVEKLFRRLIQNMSWSEQAFSRGFPNPSALPAGFLDSVRRIKDKHGPLSFDLVMSQKTAQSRPAVPVTVIWGTGDRLVPLRQMQSFLKWLGPHAFVPLERAGHMPQLEQPQQFAAALGKSIPRSTLPG